MNYHDVLKFWFEELAVDQHFKKDTHLDEVIKNRFGDIHFCACKGELYSWRESADGRLAEIIVLDQFSRNIYRDSAKAFENDTVALVLAQEAISLKQDLELEVSKRAYLYMPFMHSESLFIHSIAMNLFSTKGMEFNYKFEVEHKNIIERFGRYPHRNEVLGRDSTPEEIDFLQGPGSSF